MKTKFNNRQLAHVWAQQNQPEGRGSSFYFVGPSIYSYGSHFEIARFITRKGARAVLFTTRGYSVTTSKHIGMTRNALHGLALPVFHVANIDDAASAGHDTREAYRDRVQEARETAAKCRDPGKAARFVEIAESIAKEANAYAAFMGKAWRLQTPPMDPAALEAMRVKLAAYQARQAAKAKREKAKREKEYAQALAEWRRNERDHVPDSHLRPVALRLSNSRQFIQTTRGAEVPASVAPLVWDAVTAARESATEWRPPFGHDRPRLGSFTLDRIGPDGTITAGCHVIPYSELHALAQRFGFVS